MTKLEDAQAAYDQLLLAEEALDKGGWKKGSLGSSTRVDTPHCMVGLLHVAENMRRGTLNTSRRYFGKGTKYVRQVVHEKMAPLVTEPSTNFSIEVWNDTVANEAAVRAVLKKALLRAELDLKEARDAE